MHEHGLARELFPAMVKAAEIHELSKVTRVGLKVGVLNGVAHDFLRHSFEHVFEGTLFEGAQVDIEDIQPGQEIIAPDGGQISATGFEVIVTSLEGE